MKFRTDFVTNSSSTSYFYINFRFADGTEECFENFGQIGDWNLKQKENGLTNLWGAKVKNIKDLCASLLFYGQEAENYDEIPIEVLSALFSFIIGETDCSGLIEQIKTYESLTDERSKAKTYKDYYDFSALDAIATENDKDKNHIIKKIFHIFSEYSNAGELDDNKIKIVKDFYEKNCQVSDISMIRIGEDSEDYGEFLPYDEDYFEDPFDSENDKSDDFPQMTDEDPLFEKECTRWSDYAKDCFGIDGIAELYPETALEEGEYSYLAGSESDYGSIHKRKFYYPNGINNCLQSYHDRGEIPDNEFFTSHFIKMTNFEINTLVSRHRLQIFIPDQIKRIGRNAFRNTPIESVNFPDGLQEIGAFAFDGCGCEFSEIPESIKKIGLTLVRDLLEYAISHKVLDISESDLFRVLEYEVDHQDSEILELLAKNGYILNRFRDYPITDLLDKSIKIGFDEFIDILLNTGLELDYNDAAHYIYNDNLETLYPLFDRGLKIDSSAYDDLIACAAENGQPEYTTWLLDQKNKAGEE